MFTIGFSLSLSNEQYLAHYQGYARSVSVLGENGQRIEFPAEHLRPFLTHTGISGRFEIDFDQQHRFVALRRG